MSVYFSTPPSIFTFITAKPCNVCISCGNTELFAAPLTNLIYIFVSIRVVFSPSISFSYSPSFIRTSLRTILFLSSRKQLATYFAFIYIHIIITFTILILYYIVFDNAIVIWYSNVHKRR